jgi:SAM-dependent methyltransferase
MPNSSAQTSASAKSSFNVLGAQSCPGCDSVVGYIQLSSGKAFVQPAGGESFVQPDFQILECTLCGLLFRHPTLSDEELSAYYSSLESGHWEYSTLNPPERQISAMIASLPAGSHILDFGCSSGRLLKPWVNQHRCFGFEINAAAAEKAAERGLVMLAEEELWSGHDNQFQMVILVDVFEHLRHPAELLRRLWSLISLGGCLVIGTGNGDHWACRLDPAQFWYFRNLEHLCMLTHKYADYLEHHLSGVGRTWIMLSHYDVPWYARMRLHLAQAAYWLVRCSPEPVRKVLSWLPGFRKATRWGNAPNYGCCKDHVIFTIKKPSIEMK